MIDHAYLIPLLPIVGFVVLAVFGRRIGEPVAGWLGTLTVGASFVLSCVVFGSLLSHPSGQHREIVDNVYTWISVGSLNVHLNLLIDPLSVTMVLFVTGVSTLIHLYSIGYMKGDEDFHKFFVYLNLFVASMVLLVLGGNLLVTFVGWEGVGVCSYWLISFWFERSSAASAGKKAFLYNRIADVGFLLAVFLVFERTGTLDYAGPNGIFAHLASIGPGSRTAICLLLFVAAAGKSAQIPLFPWLADAMEGPTPVSALIHAATMVTAGVYLMCRVSPLLSLSHTAQIVVATVGVLTAFVAATIACAQNDIKKVLAYSTVSQLGYMFLAVGTGAYEAAIFLMVAHAFFKGLLFLGAGSVIHGFEGEQDLKKMGNVRRYMKLTFVTFAVAWLAIAGIPPLSGFFAKGDILDNAFARYPALWAVGIVTAGLTAYYMSRLMSLAFFGGDRWNELDKREAHPPHESPLVMTLPLVVLGIFALFGGALSLPGHPSFDPLGWLQPVFGSALYQSHQSAGTQWVLGVVDAAVAIAGLGLSMRIWTRRSEVPRLEPDFLRRSWRIDDLYDATIAKPGMAMAAFAGSVVDNRIIDGAVKGTAALTVRAGSALRRVQTGFVRQYALIMALGVVGLFAYVATRAWL